MQEKNLSGAGDPTAAGPPAQAPANGIAHGDDLNELLRALQAMRMGDFSVRMAAESTGLLGKIADTFNEIVTTNQHMARQLEQVGQLPDRHRPVLPQREHHEVLGVGESHRPEDRAVQRDHAARGHGEGEAHLLLKSQRVLDGRLCWLRHNA